VTVNSAFPGLLLLWLFQESVQESMAVAQQPNTVACLQQAVDDEIVEKFNTLSR